jgi:hypothetical protein
MTKLESHTTNIEHRLSSISDHLQQQFNQFWKLPPPRLPHPDPNPYLSYLLYTAAFESAPPLSFHHIDLAS